jgi:hypothetical protein
MAPKPLARGAFFRPLRWFRCEAGRSGNDANRTLTLGRLIRVIRARATPFGVPDGNRTRMIKISIWTGCSSALSADIESGNATGIRPTAERSLSTQETPDHHGLR